MEFCCRIGAGPKEQSLKEDRKLQLVVKYSNLIDSLLSHKHTLFRDSEGWPLALAGASAAGLLGIAGGHALALVRLPACTSVLWSFRVGDQL